MRKEVKNTVVTVTLTAIFLFVLPLATVRLWMRLEQGAYRSPVQSVAEEFTPRMRWLEEQPATPVGAAVAGAELFQAYGCYSCHSLEGERKIGPSLRGIFGTTVELNDGSTVPIDDTYLVESILQPEAKRVAGYDAAAMPSYEGLLSVEDVWALTGYIKDLE